jgi:Flp pilus assembly protein TadD
MFHLAATPTKPRGQPSDPWDGEMSKPLETLRASIAQGSTGNPQIVAALRRFNRTYPDEPHGHLLLGALYANRGWPLDALDEYAVAFQVDPSSRGAPEVLSNALSMVIHDLAGADAARFIQRTYQREALPAVDAALRENKADAAVLARLRSLRASIPGAPMTKTPANAAKATRPHL